MFLLSLFWLVLGLLVGLITIAAHLQPASGRRWRHVLAIGAVGAVCGGWVGTLLLGRYFATAMALWIAVLCSVGAVLYPRCRLWLSQRGSRTVRTPAEVR